MKKIEQETELPTLAKELEDAAAKQTATALQGVINERTGRVRGKFRFAVVDTDEDGSIKKTEPDRFEGLPLNKSAVANYTNQIKRGKEVIRLGFEEDPRQINYYQSLWKPKIGLIPDQFLKQIAIKDSLVAAILNTRSNQISAFGRELQDRFATGWRIEPRPGVMEDATPEQKELLQKKIDQASKAMSTCGSLQGVPPDERLSLSTFLALQARNGLLFGRFATEVIYTRDADGARHFHSFRPMDAGTIFQLAPRKGAAQQVRDQSWALIQKLLGPDSDLDKERWENDEYVWTQIADGYPLQVFTPEEMVVYNMYPVTDIELRGYPITPIDTVFDGVATHMNIVQHNKLYFQSGRAARGMIIIKSQDVDQAMVAQLRAHFNASINSVSNAWRVPVFGIDPEDEVEWSPFEMQGGRDMEFQYLSDQNAREICSAFQISPDELPGYQHLSRGTNSMALSESSNEFKLEAARDVGIRPLLNHFQDFLNESILPLIDKTVADLCVLKLYGLDADTEEKEDTQLTTRMPIDLTMDEILERKEKDPIGKEWGGKFLFNPSYQAVLDKYFYQGEIMEYFFDKKGAAKQPDLQFMNNPMWFQFQQLQMQAQQMEQQAQAQQQQAAAQQQQPAEGEDSESEGPGPDEGEIAQGADKAIELMSKSEKQLPPGKRRLLHIHKKIVKDAMDEWERDSKQALAEVLKAVEDETV
jgi:hypothetical protein